MSVREWQFEPIWCGIRQPLDAVSSEVVILSLLPVGDNRRACGLELLDRVPDCFIVKWLHPRMRAAVPFDSIKQFQVTNTAATSTLANAILIPKPNLVRLKSTKLSSSPFMEAPLRIRAAAASNTSVPAFNAARYEAVIWIALSGLRMSWTSIPSSKLRARSTCALKNPIDSTSAWSMASLKRMTSSRLSSSGSTRVGPQAKDAGAQGAGPWRPAG